MSEWIALAVMMTLTVLLMRASHRRRLRMLEPAPYVDVARVMRVAKGSRPVQGKGLH